MASFSWLQVIAGRWLQDEALCGGLLDNFGSCPLICQLLRSFKSLQRGVAVALLSRGAVLHSQWRKRMEREEVDEACACALDLADTLATLVTEGVIEVQEEQVGQFMRLLTASSSMAEAARK